MSIRPRVHCVDGVWHVQCGVIDVPCDSRVEAIRRAVTVAHREAEVQAKVDAAVKRAALIRHQQQKTLEKHRQIEATTCAFATCMRPREKILPGLGTFCERHYREAVTVLGMEEAAA